MKIGNIDGKLNKHQSLIYDSGTLGGSAYPDFYLSGNLYSKIDMFVFQAETDSGAGSSNIAIKFNSEASNTCYVQEMDFEGTAEVAARVSASPSIVITYKEDNTKPYCFSHVEIYPKSGQERIVIVNFAGGITAGTSVQRIKTRGAAWTNTADELTRITFLNNQLAAGSRVIAVGTLSSTAGMKTGALEIQGHIKGAWELVEKFTASGGETSKNFTGLTGNTDVLYKVVGTMKAASNAFELIPALNGVTTAGLYGYQFAYTSTGTTLTATRDTANRVQFMSAGAADNFSFGELYIWARSGYIRPMLGKLSQSIAAGTPPPTIGSLWTYGSVYNPADVNTEITSINFTGNGAGNLAAGSTIEFYKLSL